MTRPRLLLVDDALEMGVIIKALGRRSECDVAICLDAESVPAALETQVPDLLLLDVNLPGQSGPELCQHLRKDERWQRLPVAVFTHWDLSGDIARALEAGAQYVFSKDLVTQPHSWRQRLDEILGHARGQRPRPSLAWQHNGHLKEVPAAWSTQLAQVLDRTFARLVRPEIARVLVRKALAQTWPDRSELAACSAWWLAGGSLLPLRLLPEGLDLNRAAQLVHLLCEQIECVLGTQVGSPACAALAQLLVVPGEGAAHR
jgi:CheY-like chemotaxis protein